MRLLITTVLFFAAFARPSLAQDPQDAPSVTPEQRRSVSDERAAEIRAVLAQARKRQESVDRQNTDLWARWTHAVCIGCDPTPKGLRIVHTYPHRVLKGIPAAEDDRRERLGLRI
ncbi:hypothetical protein [Methylobacterium organophilum]|uniref:TIGR03759 family integrating conjugative element protein n=1 Tax=Methylobacterium organophilum TaxID=410 RepID=A0ABQ4T6G9_METOR|nr:hypothetical protein [Methylobacterium organophilum]GJE27213.1 hypothetical protein LKMONMHP_2070 [Methylobacterium organophilum]